MVNDHRLAETSALPAKSCAPISIVASYFVFGEKSTSESNIAVLPSGLREITPFKGVVSPCFFTVNDSLSIVGLFIDSLNVAVTSELTGTPVAPSAGKVFNTLGGTFSPSSPVAAVFAFSVADSTPLIPK